MAFFRSIFILVLMSFSPAIFAASGVSQLLDSYIIAKAETHQTPFTDAELVKAPYTIHVVSYINEKDAASHVEELKIQEKDVFYVPSFIKGQIWFKVCVGRFESANQAEAYRKKFMKRMDEPLAVVVSLMDRPTSKSVRSVASVEESKPAVKLIPKKEKTAATPKVETPAEAAPTEKAKKAHFYTIQVGAYPTVELAKDRITELAVKDQDIFYQEADVSGKKWFRVLVGRFSSKKEAVGYETVLKEKKIETLVRKVKSE